MRRTSQARRRLALISAAVTLAAAFGGHALTAHAAPGDITTVAGMGQCCPDGGTGDGGPANAANIPPPFGVTAAPGGYLFSENGYSADGNRVRRVQNGTLSSVAGGQFPPSSDGVPATQDYLDDPEMVVADAAGNLWIPGATGLRKVDATTGIITTPIPGAFGRHGIAIDTAGNLYAVSGADGSLKKINPVTGTITTVSSEGGDFLAVDAAGDVYMSQQGQFRIRRVDATSGAVTTVVGDGTPGFTGDGGPATSAEILYAWGISLDAAGNLYIADGGNNRIRKVDTTGTITTFAGTDEPPGNQCAYLGDGGAATAATMCEPTGVAPDGSGNVYVYDAGNAVIRKVDSVGKMTTVAGTPKKFGWFGDGGPATAAQLDGLVVALDPAGGLLETDAGNHRIRRIDGTGMITTVAGGGVGDGLPALSAMLNKPQGLATDSAGNTVIADCGDSRVRRVDAAGTITSIAGASGPKGLGDGGAATAAALECPAGVAYDSAGNLYIADSGDNRVRRVDTSGVITTVAGTGVAGFSGDGGPASTAQLNAPSGVLVDSAGNLFIADRTNNRVRKVDPSGNITTFAGDGTEGGSSDGVAATRSSLVWPVGLALGSNGRLTIAESGFASIRSVDARGYISTIAGNGIPGYSGDGGPAPMATLDGPEGIAYDSSGNLLIADYQNSVIRSVAAGTPPAPPVATKKTASCGMTVTQNLTLADDIGPCPGAGLIVAANGVHLNLNGHTISGSYGHTGQNVGIRVTSQKDVKISNGTVTGFDAGVALISGSNNIVTGMTVANNQGGPNTFNDTFGDGIVMFASSRNIITGNNVANNGPFDGIAMIGQGADNNLIQDNTVKDTTNFGRAFLPGTGLGIVTNPFLGFDRPRMVSLYSNQIIGNTVNNNGSAGISTVSNVNGVVRNNLAEHNGFQSPFGGAFPGNGIGITYAHNATPNTNELVENNQVYGNGRDGIQVVASGNQILDNIGNGNGAGAFHGFDFRDFDRDPVTFKPTCSTNTWSGNQWGTGGFFPACAGNGGSPISGTTAQPINGPPVPDGLGDPPPRNNP